MHRRLAPGRLVIATHNPGKVVEIGELLAPFGMDLVSAGELGLPEPEETAATFRGNAALKALAAATASGFPALADDSGLCVDALGGDPGLFSARWAGPGKDFGVAMQRVWDGINAPPPSSRRGPGGGCSSLPGAENSEEDTRPPAPSLTREGGPSSAHFICALCLAWPDGHTEDFEGRVDGRIVWPPRGDNGFGYDPIFLMDGKAKTYGEMPRAEKEADNHRARAFAQLVAACLS